MRPDVRSFCGCRLPARTHAWLVCIIFFVIFGRFTLPSALGDGCFVFRWNKGIDINEPTQKAIIVYDAGREDLLLQVKYEGPLEEFGWLIPVPSLPTVEKGSMQPFYELSQLTQRQFVAPQRGYAASPGAGGAPVKAVKVIEVKTVGAYEVAILSAQDAGSLQRWLRGHKYSFPGGKAGIIDEYVRKGWYFIAAKIDLGKAVSFQRASGATPKSAGPAAQSRKAIQKQLSSGELHPLLISFGTPKCIYPLRISAVSGKPSEVSLYVLSAEPLLDRFIFGTDLEKLPQWRAEWKKDRLERVRAGDEDRLNRREFDIAQLLYDDWPRTEGKEQPARDWSFEDLRAIAKEDQPPASPSMLEEEFYALPHDPLQCQRVTCDQVPQCTNDLPRLKARSWYLTKQVRAFQPREMHDLEFQPAIPVLAAMLPEPKGGTAAWLLTGFGASGKSLLVAALRSTNSLERINASSAIQVLNGPSRIELLLTLLKDDVPRIRLNAVRAAKWNWDPRFAESFLALFHDPCSEIRKAAIIDLDLWEVANRVPIGERLQTNRVPAYLALLRDPDPEVQLRALDELWRWGQEPVPRSELLRLLGTPRMDMVDRALDMLYGRCPPGWANVFSMGCPRFPAPIATNHLPSAEAAPLTTNRLTMARLMGLKILRQNADAQAVALTLPLLRDTNSLVRKRAFALLKTVSGQDIPQDDSARWEQWWAANKATFVPGKPAR